MRVSRGEIIYKGEFLFLRENSRASKEEEGRVEKIREWNWRDMYLPFFFSLFLQQRNISPFRFEHRGKILNEWGVSSYSAPRFPVLNFPSNQEARLMCLANNNVFHDGISEGGFLWRVYATQRPDRERVFFFSSREEVEILDLGGDQITRKNFLFRIWRRFHSSKTAKKLGMNISPIFYRKLGKSFSITKEKEEGISIR